MVVSNEFIIHGKKDIYFSKSETGYMTFNPIDLEYFNFDEIGSEILYCISKNFNLEQIVQSLQEEYEVNTLDCKNIILEFLEELPIKKLIYHNLIQSDIYLYMSPFKYRIVK